MFTYVQIIVPMITMCLSSSVQAIENIEVLPGNMTKVQVKVVGDLNVDSLGEEGVVWTSAEKQDLTEHCGHDHPVSRKGKGDS